MPAEYGMSCESLAEAWLSYQYWVRQKPELAGYPVQFSPWEKGWFWYVDTGVNHRSVISHE